MLGEGGVGGGEWMVDVFTSCGWRGPPPPTCPPPPPVSRLVVGEGRVPPKTIQHAAGVGGP